MVTSNAADPMSKKNILHALFFILALTLFLPLSVSADDSATLSVNTTGPNSSTSQDVNNTSNITINSNQLANITSNFTIRNNSGGNTFSDITKLGDVSTGKSNTSLAVTNTANTNNPVTIPDAPSHSVNSSVSNTGPNSTTKVSSTTTNTVNLNDTKRANVTTNVAIDNNTGNNTFRNITTMGNVTTGDNNVAISINNTVNSRPTPTPAAGGNGGGGVTMASVPSSSSIKTTSTTKPQIVLQPMTQAHTKEFFKAGTTNIFPVYLMVVMLLAGLVLNGKVKKSLKKFTAVPLLLSGRFFQRNSYASLRATIS